MDFTNIVIKDLLKEDNNGIITKLLDLAFKEYIDILTKKKDIHDKDLKELFITNRRTHK